MALGNLFLSKWWWSVWIRLGFFSFLGLLLLLWHHWEYSLVERPENIEHLTLFALEVNPRTEALCFVENPFRLDLCCGFFWHKGLDIPRASLFIGLEVAREVPVQFADKFAASLAILTECEQRQLTYNRLQVSKHFTAGDACFVLEFEPFKLGV